jgi:hypothetical protein
VLYELVLFSMSVVWVRKLCVLVPYDDSLCISGRRHALPEWDVTVLL